MKSDKSGFLLLVLIGIVVIVFLIVFPFKKIPQGVPNDYYDRINLLDDSGVNLYLYSDDIDFNGDYRYIDVFGWSDVINTSSSHMKVLVLDMNKNLQQEFATEEQIQRLYDEFYFTIIIVNYASSGSTQLEHLIDPVDLESDIIIFSFDANHNQYSGSVSGEFPTNQMLMYAILDNIAYILEENNQ